MKDISATLRALGLAESDIITYLTTLKNGPSTVVDLAKRTKLSRQAVYLSIDAMTERGLMSSVQRGKKRFFTAEAPNKLLAHAKRQAQKIEEHISDLEKLIPQIELQAGGERPNVRLYEGKESIHAYTEDLKRMNVKQIDEMTDIDALHQVFSTEELSSLRKHILSKSMKIRGIFASDDPELIKSGRHMLPKSMRGFKSNIAVYENTIAFTTFANKTFSVVIEDKNIAQAMKYLFELADKTLELKK